MGGRGCHVIYGNSRNLRELLNSNNETEPFDLIISSPPYGDSFTTVQHGGISSICLGIISNIQGLAHLKKAGKDIDKDCLGGRITLDSDYIDSEHKQFSCYWRGSKSNQAALRVYQYLDEIKKVCVQISEVLRSDGCAIFIISRRRVGNWRLYRDIFLEDVFKCLDIKIQQKKLKIKKKLLPRQVQRFARSVNPDVTKNNKILTMSEEYIMVFKKLGQPETARNSVIRLKFILPNFQILLGGVPI